MKSILKKIGLIGLFVSTSAFAAPAVFEDFSNGISTQKFDVVERGMTVDSSELLLSAKGKSYITKNIGDSIFLTNSNGITNYSADLKVSEVVLGNSKTQQAEIRIWGYFYLTDTGRVFASISLGDRGNGLEAKYSISNDKYDSNGQYLGFDDIATGSLALGGLSLDTAYRAIITYDGATGLTFIFNGGTPVTVAGPTKSGDSPFWKAVGTRVRFGENNSTPDNGNDELPEDGSIAYVVGSVDNVTTDVDRPSDDFSSANLDNWNKLPSSSLITDDGQLEMSISQTSDGTSTQRMSINQQGLKYIGAKVTLSSKSTPSETARVRGRIIHYVGNDTYDQSNGDTPNGFEGDIFTQFTIERKADGVFRAFVYISRASDADFNSEEEILFQEITLSNPVAYDVQYDLAIEEIDKTVNFLLDGEIVASFDLTTSDVFSDNLYSASGTSSTQLNARIQNGSGKVVALFDDITTSLMPSIITLNGTNSDDQTVELPAEVIANVGELVTLLANAENASDIIKYVWEQIGGPDVDVTAVASRASSVNSALSARVVGIENSLSFMVPAGSDGQDLAFKLTTVSTSGLETEKNFTLSVDNSQTSTLSPVATIEPEPTSSGGGGSFNFLFIFMLLLTFTAKLRLRSDNRA